MATVMVTSRVIEATMDSIRKNFQGQIDALSTAINAEPVPELTYRCFVSESLESELAHLRTLVPTGWNVGGEVTEIRISFDKISGLPQNWEVPISPPRVWFNDHNSYRYYGLNPIHSDVHAELVKIIKPRIEALNTVNANMNKVLNQTRKLLEQAKTVNKAVKVWPQLINLLPKEILEKLYTKLVRKTADKLEEELEIDVDDLAAGLTAARLFHNPDKMDFIQGDWSDLDKALNQLLEE